MYKRETYYLTCENIEYLDIMARIAGTNKASVLNKILDERREKDAIRIDAFKTIVQEVFAHPVEYIPDVRSRNKRKEDPWDECIEREVDEIYRDEAQRNIERGARFEQYFDSPIERDGYVRTIEKF